MGVIGFVGALFKMIRQTNPTHLTVLFDGESENSFNFHSNKANKANKNPSTFFIRKKEN